MVNFDKEFEYRHELFEDVDLIFSLARGYSVYKKGTRYQDVLQEADSMMYANKKDIKAKYNFTGR